MTRTTALAALAALSLTATAEAQNLRIGLREDPDILDPTLARTFVGRIVFASLCDKLFDINEKLEIVPQLASGHRWEDPKTLLVTLREGVKFHDGEAMDAESVRYSLNRHLTLQGSFRRGEINTMESVEVVDPRTVRIRLKEPSAPFLSQLTDRAGTIVSPKAAEAAGRNFGTKPVCAGPYRFVERVAQDRIVVERFPGYWNAQAITIPRITYLPIPDNTVRLANLQSGALEMVQTIEPDDIKAVQRNARLKVLTYDGLGYQSITYNLANGPRAETPFAKDARIRAAFELAIDRDAINQVVYEGAWTVTAQPVPPSSPYHVKGFQPQARDLETAKALLRQAGVTAPVPVEMTIPNSPDLRQVGEVIQAMVKEAGFELKLNTMEFASSLQAANRGEFETYLINWSGRVDPDGNTWTFMHTNGAQNDGKYGNPEVDKLLDAARVEQDMEKRRDLYGKAFRIAIREDRSRIYLWHAKNIVAHTTRLSGFVPVPDGLIRPQGLRLQ
ncbi:ABC transporter substrate-binding protein [Paracraurococcus lichenis]|uniref:ABC transporter substrate-binding protein n=1 Tax=Paracraurococcus lichenis TaxID=3064888 RepID=A0ABT9DWM9_9PROT|nr:ABC transporter substrate-binding protein [Paracraurococcus sp. LOR1-02]MDO9708308.1 ABC transporter substrate-binding protein [Paracraurococcus sp. LOR1-02]